MIEDPFGTMTTSVLPNKLLRLPASKRSCGSGIHLGLVGGEKYVCGRSGVYLPSQIVGSGKIKLKVSEEVFS